MGLREGRDGCLTVPVATSIPVTSESAGTEAVLSSSVSIVFMALRPISGHGSAYPRGPGDGSLACQGITLLHLRISA